MIKNVQVFEDLSLFSPKIDQPCIIKNVAKKWPASTKWGFDFFNKNYGDLNVSLSDYINKPNQKNRDKKKIKLKEYLNNVITNENYNEYLAGWHFKINAPELINDIIIPKVFQENLIDHVSENIINFETTSLFIGHKNVDSPLHTDSFFVCVWLVSIIGNKTIRFVEPKDYKNIKNGLNVFDDSVVNNLDSFGNDVLHGDINESDMVYIPPGWWHQVKNKDFNIAISTNFIDKNHFLTFEQQLRAKIMSPYLKLLQYKHQLFKDDSNLDVSTSTLKYANYSKNESVYINHMQSLLNFEQSILKNLPL